MIQYLAESRGMAEPIPTTDTRHVDRATSWGLSLPTVGWEPRKGSRSTQDGHHPPYEEQSLAARATWVSAHAGRNVLCPWYQTWPSGTSLSPEVLAQNSQWDSASVPTPCCGQGPSWGQLEGRPVWGLVKQGPNFAISIH